MAYSFFKTRSESKELDASHFKKVTPTMIQFLYTQFLNLEDDIKQFKINYLRLRNLPTSDFEAEKLEKEVIKCELNCDSDRKCTFFAAKDSPFHLISDTKSTQSYLSESKDE